MRRWKCIYTKYEGDMRVGAIVETDDNGCDGKWLSGDTMWFSIYDYNKDGDIKFEEIKSEKELLEEYKTNKENEIRENAETELFEKYSELKSLEGFEKIIENKSNFSLDDIERD